MWPQLGYRQGYSDGEDGGVLLNKRLANVRVADFSKECGMRTKPCHLD